MLSGQLQRIGDSANVRRWLGCAITIGCLLVGCGSRSVSGGGQPVITTVPFTLIGEHAIVEVQINGRSARLLLDTGADQNVLTRAATMRLSLEPSNDRVPGSGAGGTYGSVPWVHIDTLDVGAFAQSNQIAFVVPMPEEFTADGVLGTPFFQAFVASIDYQQRRLTLHARESFVPPAGIEPIPVAVEGGKLTVIATAAGVTGAYTVDTGAGNAVTLFSPTVATYGLRGTFSPAIRTVTGVSPGGQTYGDLVRLSEVVIGRHRFSHVVAELSLAQSGLFANPRFLGNLGAEIWRRFTVTLDYASARLYLEPNAAYSEPFVASRCGLVTAWKDGEIFVIDVMADSPAAQSAIVVGDRVLAINGAVAGELTPQLVRAAFQQAPGSLLAVRVRNEKGDERDVTMMLRELL